MISISNTNSSLKLSFLGQTVQKLEKMLKMTMGHNFVKNKKSKKSKSHSHLQTMMKHSAKFQVNSTKDMAGVAGTRYESARAITLSEMVETKIRTYMYIFI